MQEVCVLDVQTLYEDKDIIVVVKPPGMPSQGDRTSTMDVVSYLKNLSGLSYVGVVHRLDRPVGGVMVYAKTRQAAAGLSQQIQKNQVIKKYKVVLTGKPQNNEGTLINYLLRDGKTNTSAVVSENTSGAKQAKLNYKVLKTKEIEDDCLTLAEVELLTGRHHQIRVQMAAAGAGVWGDTKYNPQFHNKKGAWFNIGLFSYQLAFMHPINKKKMQFTYEPKESPFNMF